MVTMKYFLALLFAIVVGAAAHALEPNKTHEWRWIELGNLTDHWASRGGHANVEMKDGKISAQSVPEGEGGVLYEISGIHRWENLALFKKGLST